MAHATVILRTVLAFAAGLAIAAGSPAATDRTMSERKTYRDCPECPEMVIVPGGSIDVAARGPIDGRIPDDPVSAWFLQPAYRARIPARLAVGKYLVTRKQYQAFVNATRRTTDDGCYVWNGDQWTDSKQTSWRNPGFEQTDNDPVVCVSWDDAMAYVAWLNGTKAGDSDPYRVPTLDEATYAAAAGAQSDFYWGEEPRRDRANYGADACIPCQPASQDADRWMHTSPVDAFPPNRFGLHDTLGNVWQWTSTGSPCAAAPRSAPCFRYVRGGSWLDSPAYVRTQAVTRWDVENRNHATGFRVAAGGK